MKALESDNTLTPLPLVQTPHETTVNTSKLVDTTRLLTTTAYTSSSNQAAIYHF
jgi:hypothetical protein